MTRHGMVEPSAAGAPPPATGKRAPTVIADADGGVKSRAPGRQHREKAQRSGPFTSTPGLPSGGRVIADTGGNPKSP